MRKTLNHLILHQIIQNHFEVKGYFVLEKIQFLIQVGLQNYFVLEFYVILEIHFHYEFLRNIQYILHRIIIKMTLKKDNTNRKHHMKNPAAGAARIQIFYSSPPPSKDQKTRQGGDL